MDKQDLRDLLRKEYENGTGITELCKKYNQSINTVKRWRKRDGWKKKQINAPLTNAPPKKKIAPPKQKGANEKETQIKADIINNVPKEEILEKHGIKKSTYYNKAKSIRQLRKERTEKYLEQIADEVYKGELYRILKGTETAKANLVVRTTKEINSQEMDTKKVQEYEKAYTTIKKMGNDLMRTGKMLTAYEVLEIDRQLAEEEISREKLEIEKAKIQKDDDKDSEKEKEVIQLLRNITKKVENNE